MAVVWIAQRDQRWLAPVLPHALLEAAVRFPALDAQVWVLIFAVLFYLYRCMAGLSTRFAEQDVSSSE